MKTGFTENFLLLSLILVLRYFLGAGLFHWFFSNRSKNTISKEDIKWSVYSSVVFAFFGAVTLRLWELKILKVYIDWDLYGLTYLPLSLVIYLVIHDTYFYWSHRLLHNNYFRKIHVIHHLSRRPTAFTSFSFHPIEAVFQAILLPVLLLFIPVHLGVLIVYLIVMSIFGITNHLGFEIYPGWIEKKLYLITASHHQKHHENFDTNFGLYFSFWDRLMRTEKGIE